MEGITQDVILDLWPVYQSGEASPDTRALVEAYLSKDPEFARTLAELDREQIPAAEPPSLAPDHELKTLTRIKHRLTGPRPLLTLAMIFSLLAFGRIVSDTSFTVSPGALIATAIVAACFWAAFWIRLFRGRREVLIRLRH